jgi:hypothetical protein
MLTHDSRAHKEKPVTAEMVSKLKTLKAQPKFVDEPGTIYNGMRPEQDRLAAESVVDHLIETFILENSKLNDRRWVRRQFTQSLKRFNGHDTEDRERMCRYVEQIANIIEMPTPRRILTFWLYGPVLGTLLLL